MFVKSGPHESHNPPLRAGGSKASTLMVSRRQHISKDSFPIAVRLAGRVRDRRLEHPKKALAPIVVRPSGRVMETRLFP